MCSSTFKVICASTFKVICANTFKSTHLSTLKKPARYSSSFWKEVLVHITVLGTSVGNTPMTLTHLLVDDPELAQKSWRVGNTKLWHYGWVIAVWWLTVPLRHTQEIWRDVAWRGCADFFPPALLSLTASSGVSVTCPLRLRHWRWIRSDTRTFDASRTFLTYRWHNLPFDALHIADLFQFVGIFLFFILYLLSVCYSLSHIFKTIMLHGHHGVLLLRDAMISTICSHSVVLQICV